MANNYPLSRPKHWDSLGRAGLEMHLGETEAALYDLEGALNATASRLDGSINTVSSTLDGRISALSMTLEGKISAAQAAKEVATGTYVGNGETSRDIFLGFQPRAVLVEIQSGARTSGGGINAGLALPGAPLSFQGQDSALEVTASGFRLHNAENGSCVNDPPFSYYYLAFKEPGL